jgi:pilus assembly protein Flp/PilA
MNSEYFPSNRSKNNRSGIVRRLIDDTNGVTAIEYGLIAALIAVAAVAIMATVGTDLSTTFSEVSNCL